MIVSSIAKALDHIDEDLVAEALEAEDKVEAEKRKKTIQRNKFLKVACLCLLVVAFGWRLVVPAQSSMWGDNENDPSQPSSSGVIVSEDGVTIPPMEVTLSVSHGESASMIGFFIYQGRCYVHYMDIYEDVDLIDQYMGTITGMIDEWTPKDGYVDYAGSARGEFYSVEGFDPDFMLCMKRDDGAVSLFINNTGITLKYGSELFEDRLHLSENIAGVQYETSESWFHGLDQLYDLDADHEIIGELIRQLNEEKVIPSEEILIAGGKKYLSELREYFVYLRLKNGASAGLILYQGGYVEFSGIRDICVKISEETYQALKKAFEDAGTPATQIPDRMGVTEEECRQDPQLGAYVPTFVAPQVELEAAYIHYDIEPQTGEEIRTGEIWLSYQGPDPVNHYCNYGITIRWTEDPAYTGWLTGTATIDRSELNLEAISEYMKPYKRMGQIVEYGGELHMRVRFDSVTVEFNSWGIDEETVLKILQSIP